MKYQYVISNDKISNDKISMYQIIPMIKKINQTMHIGNLL